MKYRYRRYKQLWLTTQVTISQNSWLITNNYNTISSQQISNYFNNCNKLSLSLFNSDDELPSRSNCTSKNNGAS